MKSFFQSLKPFIVCLLLTVCASGLSFFEFDKFGITTTSILVSGCFMSIVVSAANSFNQRESALNSIGTILLIISAYQVVMLFPEIPIPALKIPPDLLVGVWVGYLIGYLTHIIS